MKIILWMCKVVAHACACVWVLYMQLHVHVCASWNVACACVHMCVHATACACASVCTCVYMHVHVCTSASRVGRPANPGCNPPNLSKPGILSNHQMCQFATPCQPWVWDPQIGQNLSKLSFCQKLGFQGLGSLENRYFFNWRGSIFVLLPNIQYYPVPGRGPTLVWRVADPGWGGGSLS